VNFNWSELEDGSHRREDSSGETSIKMTSGWISYDR
jgi:hypothetical protein